MINTLSVYIVPLIKPVPFLKFQGKSVWTVVGGMINAPRGVLPLKSDRGVQSGFNRAKAKKLKITLKWKCLFYNNPQMVA